MLIPGVGQWAAATWYNAATIGFVSGGIATGSLRGALVGALSGAAFQQIGKAFNVKNGFWKTGGAGHIGSHAVTGGITSVLNGGKFRHGFFSAGLTKSFNVNELLPGISDGMNSARVAVAAIIGGTIFRGSKVFQRNDLIDPKLVDGRGRTNLERMQKGLAPIGSDGKSINLHHLTQKHDDAIAEMTQTFHQQNSKIIHINPSSVPSGIDRAAFNKWRTAYWKSRANNF